MQLRIGPNLMLALAGLLRQAVAIIDPITTQVAEVAAHEVEHARESQGEAEATHQATR